VPTLDWSAFPSNAKGSACPPRPCPPWVGPSGGPNGGPPTAGPEPNGGACFDADFCVSVRPFAICPRRVSALVGRARSTLRGPGRDKSQSHPTPASERARRVSKIPRPTQDSPGSLDGDGGAERRLHGRRRDSNSLGVLLGRASVAQLVKVDRSEVNRVAPFDNAVVAQVVFCRRVWRYCRQSAWRSEGLQAAGSAAFPGSGGQWAKACETDARAMPSTARCSRACSRAPDPPRLSPLRRAYVAFNGERIAPPADVADPGRLPWMIALKPSEARCRRAPSRRAAMGMCDGGIASGPRQAQPSRAWTRVAGLLRGPRWLRPRRGGERVCATAAGAHRQKHCARGRALPHAPGPQFCVHAARRAGSARTAARFSGQQAHTRRMQGPEPKAVGD